MNKLSKILYICSISSKKNPENYIDNQSEVVFNDNHIITHICPLAKYQRKILFKSAKILRIYYLNNLKKFFFNLSRMGWYQHQWNKIHQHLGFIQQTQTIFSRHTINYYIFFSPPTRTKKAIHLL